MEYIEKNKGLIFERGLSALGTLMGFLMRELRGRVKPEVVNRILKEKILGEITIK